MRLHIIEALRHRCVWCGQGPVRNGRPLQFVLDHVDGDSSTDRRDNLRLSCHHGDSQLPTYKNRRNGRGRHARRLRYENGQSC